MNLCLRCLFETSNPKFCSKSCAAIYNNAKPKRKLQPRACTACGKDVQRASYRDYRRRCLTCTKAKTQALKDICVGEYRNKQSVKGKHPSWTNAHVRSFNRSWNKAMLGVCEVCGYTKHQELCHIRAVADFPDAATLGEINNPINIRVLCRNCHWELDHSL